jgi:hypothetical protein
MAINPSRGEPLGVDVEVEPFGPVNPFSRDNPKAATGSFGKGAYVEFDLPATAFRVVGVGPRNNYRIPTSTALSLIALRPKFVTIRWWQLWKWWNR